MVRLLLLALVVGLPFSTVAAQEATRPIKLLFLGDNGHHRPLDRFRQLQPVLEKRGIELAYTDKVEALNAKTLAPYDGLLIYANTVKIAAEQEQALLDFVESGKGLIPVHCASYCFLNSPKYVALVGAQFQRHGTGTFRAVTAQPEHPIMKGYQGFESWDETYVHTRHNDSERTVLEYRSDGAAKEPWTWVRTQGKGRVFYTAWGHDQRTWGNPGFQDLLERGIRWATRRLAADAASSPAQRVPFAVPAMTARRTDVKPLEYVDVGGKIPNYKGGKGATLSRMQLPLAAEESLKHLIVPQGFRVELVAADPDIRRALCMNWDERGRLWIAESLDYPHELGKGQDRLVICEDTNGDGRSDKFTVFADKLSIPSSFLFYKGGVIVFENRQTTFLQDTDGDDRADVRHVLFDGWGMGDTHGGVSNMHYGLDNWIWATQGYNSSRVTLGSDSVQFRQGFFRFKPPSVAEPKGAPGRIEFVRSTNNNTWGLGFSEEGLVFGSTANGNPSVYMPIANRYYEAVGGWARSLVLRPSADSFRFQAATDKVRQVDFHGGYTAAAGHALYTARNYPRTYWNRTAFVCEPTGHLVGTFVLRREGSDFRSSNPFNLLASDDEWTAPIMAEVGPDGNVWVVDWYNYIVQHNPTPQGFKTGRGAAYETELRDKKHGRVYRLVHEGAPASRAMTLKDARPEQLVAALKHDNMFWRKHAQRLLVERAQRDVVPALIRAVGDTSVDDIGLNVGVIHSLWTLHGLGVLDGTHAEATRAVQAALTHKSAGVRRNAVQVLPVEVASVQALLQAGLTEDPDELVRLQALLALAHLPAAPQAGQAVVTALKRAGNASDRWLPDAATSAAARNGSHFLAAVAAQKQPGEGLLTVATLVAEHYARQKPADSVAGLIATLADAEVPAAEAVLRGLAKGWPRQAPPPLTPALERDLSKLATRLPATQRSVLIQLATAWGSKQFEQALAEVAAALLTRVRNASLSVEERSAAARALIESRGDKQTVGTLLAEITPRTPPELAAGILGSLQASAGAETGELIVERLPSLTPGARAAALGVVLSRPEWTQAYLDRVEKGVLPLAELSLDQKQALAAHPSRSLRERALALLKKGGVLPNADRQKVVEELLAVTKTKGDAAAGKLVFKNACAKCHVHSGDGERIGPDLSGVAVHTKEHLLGDIIDPSRSVEGNFRLYAVTTRDGLVLQGMLAGESKTAIELFDAEGKKKTVLREDIDELAGSTKSLMPDGFEKQLKRTELVDLLEFLTLRGKYLPLPLDKVATALSTRGLFYSEDAKAERLVFDDWKPKTFEGVPFHLVDPQQDRVPNIVLFYAPQGKIPPKMPKSVSLPCNSPARAIHLLSGVSGWGYPYTEQGSVCLIVRLHYDDGKTEDHPLLNGVHFADYIRKVDVPGSKFAFDLRGRQIRYLAVRPQRSDRIERIELVKGSDPTAPVVMAVTVEGLD